jgi:hypothetical protein
MGSAKRRSNRLRALSAGRRVAYSLPHCTQVFETRAVHALPGSFFNRSETSGIRESPSVRSKPGSGSTADMASDQSRLLAPPCSARRRLRGARLFSRQVCRELPVTAGALGDRPVPSELSQMLADRRPVGADGGPMRARSRPASAAAPQGASARPSLTATCRAPCEHAKRAIGATEIVPNWNLCPSTRSAAGEDRRRSALRPPAQSHCATWSRRRSGNFNSTSITSRKAASSPRFMGRVLPQGPP